MPCQLITIKQDGTIEEETLDQSPTLEQLQCAVDGFIEVIPDFSSYEGKDCVAFCNEEGLWDKLPNPVAQAKWERALGHKANNFLVGDIAIVVGDEETLKDL